MPACGAQEACFTETGHCLAEPFLTYWRTHGGLAIHGYPLSTAGPEQLEDGKSYTVQYFERSRFEHHPEHAGTPFEVLLGHFGRALYPTDPGRPLATAAPPLPGATYFDATGHNLRGGFLAYWEAHGGLAQFGYPLSEEL
ncbi:MAG TPA: peptidoglycan hydrolase, partial [Chloroflexota bacterium]|nr:peptidoglycan hydrolase [Chloroflexota bacterium]